MAGKTQHFDPRQVIYREDFEIFHYKEPKAPGVEIHHHDFYEIYYLIRGNVEYWVEGSQYRLEKGDIFLVRPMELHRPVVRPEGEYERIVLWIRKEYLESLSGAGMDLTACFQTEAKLLRPSHTKYHSISARLYELVEEFSSKEQGGFLAAKGLLLQFMVELNRLAAQSSSGPRRGSADLVGKVIAYINAHANEPLSLEELARRFYVSNYYLSHEFGRETGVSVYRYIMMKRLLTARQLLGQGVPAGEACYQCGFRDYAGFYRAFKAEYGISPKAFSEAQASL
jgi:AraC-like DNA-binding protein/quercetin dioxygenase-like cupin family protein